MPSTNKEVNRLRAKRWRERHPERAKEVARNSARKIRGYIGAEERSKRATERNKARWSDADWRLANEEKIVAALNHPSSVAKRTPKISETYQSQDLKNLSRQRMLSLHQDKDFRNKLRAGWHKGKGCPSRPEKELFDALLAAGVVGLEAQYPIGLRDLDIVHHPTKINIEVDGPYWHRDKERDAKRDEFVRGHGWKVIRVELVDNAVPQERVAELVKLLAPTA